MTTSPRHGSLDEIKSKITEGTWAAIGSLVDARIDREYGRTVDVGDGENVSVAAMIDGATRLALAGVQADIRADYLALPDATEELLAGAAVSLLRELVSEGLAARVCQCPSQVAGTTAHDHSGQCERHFEADMPPVDGLMLCGTCFIAETERGRQA